MELELYSDLSDSINYIVFFFLHALCYFPGWFYSSILVFTILYLLVFSLSLSRKIPKYHGSQLCFSLLKVLVSILWLSKGNQLLSLVIGIWLLKILCVPIVVNSLLLLTFKISSYTIGLLYHYKKPNGFKHN